MFGDLADSHQISRHVVEENDGLAHERDLLWLSICSGMFSEGSKIPIEDLVLIGMGLKLFGDVHDITIRQRAHAIAENIRCHHENSLRVVEDDYDKQYVEMPVGTTYFVLRSQFMFERDIITEDLLNRTGYEHCLGLSLVIKRIGEFPVNLICPKLVVLLLQYGEVSAAPPFIIFQGMKNLRVLSLDVPSFPNSLILPKNLRVLRLKVLKMIDMSVIGGLVNLEYLLISTSSSLDIPRVIGELENLKVLDLRKATISYISPGVFTRMLKLEELYLPLSFRRWGCRAKEEGNDHDEWESKEENHRDNEERINASLGEIFSPSLKILQICIPNASLLLKESPAYKSILQFKILGANDRMYQPFDHCYMNIVQLTGYVCDIEGNGICNLMSRTEHLSLSRVKNLKNLLHQLKDYQFPWLKEMLISECDELECIFDVMENHTYFNMLEALKSLHLSMLSDLKEICRGKQIGRFRDLTQINIRFCHKLKYALPMSMAGQLRNLKSIEILNCDELEGIFKAGVDDYPYEFCTLEELYLHSLPKLVGFLVEKDYSHDAVYDNADQSSTINEAVSDSMNLEAQITGFDVTFRPTSKSQWINKLLLCTQKVGHNKLVSRMKNKDVISPLEMNCAFSSKLLEEKRLGNLKKLKIAFCDSLRVIFSCKGMRKGKNKFKWILDSLIELELFGLRNLVHIWFQVPSNTRGFRNLQLLVLVDCHNLYLFSPRVAKLLVQLQKIEVSRCEMMEEIVAEENKNKVDKVVFGRLRVVEFQHMPKLRFFYGGISLMWFPLLESLKLNQCNKMETFSHGSFHTPMLERIQLNGSIHSTGTDLNATLKQWMGNV